MDTRASLSRRRFLHLSATVAVGATLAACAPGVAPSEGEPSGPEEIELTHMTTPISEEAERAVFARFEEEHPGVTVKPEYVAFSAMFEKIQTLAAAGDLPDIFFSAAGWVREFERLGILADLRPVFEVLGGIDPDKYLVRALEAVSTGDKIWGIPWAIHYTYLFYNKTMFDEAGVGYPNDEWTWTDVRDAAIQLTKTDDSGDITQYGFVSRPSYEGLEPACLSNGGQFFEGFDQVVFDSPQNVETVQWWVDLIHSDHVSPLPADYAQLQGGDIGYMASGKVAMMTRGGWAIDTLRTQEEFEWDMTVLPIGSEGRIHITWPDSWSVASNSDHPDLSVELILALASDPASVTYYTLPFIRSVMDDPVWRQEGTLPVGRIETLLAASADSVPGAEMTTYRWTEWYETWVNELTLSFIGERDVAESVRVAAESMQLIVSDI